MPFQPALVAVVGASGGLGASTLALAVGRRASATGPPTVVVDLALARGGLEVTAGVEHLPGRRWDDLREVRGRVPADLLLSSLPGEAGCSVLSARGGSSPTVPERAVLDVLDSLAGIRAHVVLDLPVSSPLLVPVLARSPLVVVVLGLTARSIADADACVGRLVAGSETAAAAAAAEGLEGPTETKVAGRLVEPDLRLVTRGGRAPGDVLDDVVAHLGAPHLHHLPTDDRVRRDAERGLFPGVSRDAVRRCADAVVGALDEVAEAS